jgi:hypothetical protein
MIEQKNYENLNQQKHSEVENTSSKRPLSKGMNVVKSATAITVLLAATISSTNAFSPSTHVHMHPRQIDGRGLVQSESLIYSNRREDGDSFMNKSHSHTVLSVKKERRRESRLGVRRRVRSVLERAKSRTGIRNNSEYKEKGMKKKDPARERDIGPKSSFDLANIEIEMPALSSVASVIEGSSVEETNVSPDIAPSQNVDVRSESISINKDSSINDIAEAASIGGIGSAPLDYTAPTSSAVNPQKKKTKPASTYSDEVKTFPSPGDDFVAGTRDLTIFDALKGDVSAAFSMPPPPLPFTLPELTDEQTRMLRDGERIEYQSDMGREGSGYVVLDVKAPSAVVWECLLDFYSYPQTIPTVRDVQMFTNTHLKQNLYSEEAVERKKYEDGTLATLKHGVPSVTRASFSLSKFRLKIAAIHKYRPHPLGDYMVFTLDPACTNAVLRNAKGVWYTQSSPDGRGDRYTRVWLLCELGVSSLLPQWITDYAAKRAMPRATTWIKPHVEAAAELWFKELKD